MGLNGDQIYNLGFGNRSHGAESAPPAEVDRQQLRVTVPTISQCDARTARKPSSITGWSSANKVRGRFQMVLVLVDPQTRIAGKLLLLHLAFGLIVLYRVGNEFGQFRR